MLTTQQRNDAVFSTTVEVLSLSKQRFAYNEQGEIKYIGIAAVGSMEDDLAWLIKKLTYDVAGQITAIDFAGASLAYDKSFTQRETYTYG